MRNTENTIRDEIIQACITYNFKVQISDMMEGEIRKGVLERLVKICKICSLYSMKLKNDLLSKQNKPSKVEKYLNLLYISVQNTMVKENCEEMASFYLTASNPLQCKVM